MTLCDTADAAVDPMIDGGSGSPDGAPVGALALPSLGNNSGRSDVAFGDGSQSNLLLRRPVELRVIDAAPGIVAGPAFISRTGASASATTTVFVHVANHSDARRCFVNSEGLRYFDADGQLVGHQSSMYLVGSVGRFSFQTSLQTSTCLAAGEDAYVVDFFADVDYQAVSVVDFVLDASSLAYVEPAATVRPEQAAAIGAGLSLSVKNQGPEPVKVASFGNTWILFDADHLPVAAGFLRPCDGGASLQLAAGATLAMCDDSVVYRGRGQTVQSWIEFDDGSTAKASAPSAEKQAEDAVRERLRARLADRARRR